MATVMVPTMRAKVDHNPRGSATTHVTMPEANPFQRETVSVRVANQPKDMLPGMGELGEEGGFWSGFSAGFTGQPADGSGTSGTTGTPTAGGGSQWGNLFGSILQPIVQTGIDVGKDALINELRPSQPTQGLDQDAITTMLIANQMNQQPAPQPAQLPNAGQAQQLPVINVTAPPAQQQAPQKTNYLPWIIGGAAVLAVGGIFLMKRKRR